MHKTCPRCDVSKPLEDFGMRNTAKARRQSWCRVCMSVERKVQYASYKKRGLHKQAQRRSVDKVRSLIAEAKSKPCADCNRTFPPVCMDFDHLRDKVSEIGLMKGYGIQRVLEEIAKCEVVCACCHRIRTESRRLAQQSEQGSYTATVGGAHPSAATTFHSPIVQ